MKNVLCTLAFALIGSFSFASNAVKVNKSNINPPQNCTFTIVTTVTYPSSLSYTYESTHTTNAFSLQDCIDKAQNYVNFLNG